MQYFHSIGRYTTLNDIEDKSTLKERIDESRVQVDIRNHNGDKSDRLNKSTNPGNLKKKKD